MLAVGLPLLRLLVAAKFDIFIRAFAGFLGRIGLLPIRIEAGVGARLILLRGARLILIGVHDHLLLMLREAAGQGIKA